MLAGGLAVLLIVGISTLEVNWDWVESLILLVTAALVGWYAWEARRMANQAANANDIAMAAIRMPHHSELQAWQVSASNIIGEAHRILAVENSHSGAALNVVVHPLHRGWDATLPYAAMASSEQQARERASEVPTGRTRSWSVPVLGGRERLFVAVNGLPTEKMVLCVQWDDQAYSARRWRCWEFIHHEKDLVSQVVRKRLEGPVAECETMCPVKRKYGQCPQILKARGTQHYLPFGQEHYGQDD